MFAPVIHTYGAISSVRNVRCVYLWLQNPPDRGRLIFMGSVNRDFVFWELQEGKKTHNSHSMQTQKCTLERRGKSILQASIHTLQQYTDRRTCMCRDTCTRQSAIKCAVKLNTIWQTVLQKYRKTPCVYIVRDFLIICTLSPSLLLSTP